MTTPVWHLLGMPRVLAPTKKNIPTLSGRLMRHVAGPHRPTSIVEVEGYGALGQSVQPDMLAPKLLDDRLHRLRLAHRLEVVVAPLEWRAMSLPRAAPRPPPPGGILRFASA